MQDLRDSWRNMRAAPGSALLVILTLGLGIGANTAMFSVLYPVLLAPPPYPAGERLVQIWEATDGQKIPVSWINFQNWLHQNHSFEDMSGVETADLTMIGRGSAQVVHAGVVSANFFHLTGWRPLRGRLFSKSDDRPGAAPTVLLTGEFWVRALGANPGILGATLTLDGKAYQIVGILPPGLKYFSQPIDFYVPVAPRDGLTVNRADHGAMMVLGLLKRGVGLASARADLDRIMRRVAIADPGPESTHRSAVDWLASLGVDDIREKLLLLMGAVVLVLLTAGANVASLLLLRASARTREFAIRSALGAGWRRLARQLIVENLVIASLGGVAGLALAAVCVRLLVREGPLDIPRLWEAGVNLPVLSFTAAITLLTSLITGLAPVLNTGKVDLTTSLKEGSAGAGVGRSRHSLRAGLLIAEIAVTLLFCFGCGLLLRSLAIAQNHSPGFNAGRVLALELQLPPSTYKSDDALRRFHDRLIQDLRRQPGVASVGAVNCPPSAECARGWYSIADMPAPSQADVPLAFLSSVDPEYFRALDIRLLAGRGFTAGDSPGAPCVAIVNAKLARHWWTGEPQRAVGHPLKLGGPYMDGGTCRIIGVVNSLEQSGLDAEPYAEIHVAFAQSPSPAMVIMIRSATGHVARLIPAVRHQVAAIDDAVPIRSLRPFEQWMEGTLERRRFTTLLLGIFAALAVALAVVGIYGALNQWVGARQKEIAIRKALGAQQTEIVLWTGRLVLRPAGMGIAAGVLGCLAASRWLQSLVFGISPRDPIMLVAAVAGVIAVAALAASVPVWRATRVDAIRNLRDA